MTNWKSYKSQTPFQFVVAPSESYNEGNKIAFSPKIPGKSPVWSMNMSGVAITPTHTPCRYWTGEGWEYKSWLERVCMGLEIDYTDTLMFADETQTLRVKDSNGDITDTDIVVWFLTGVGSINADIGSSIVYTAPSDPVGTDTAVIEMWCNGVLRDTLTITFAGKITYTAPHQPFNSTQDISIDNPNPACEYVWELVGGGSLSTYTGPTTVYTAPSSNTNCEYNATITLKCNDTVIDVIEIAVHTDKSWVAGYICDYDFISCTRRPASCPGPSCYSANISVYLLWVRCDGVESPMQVCSHPYGYGTDCAAAIANAQAYCSSWPYGIGACALHTWNTFWWQPNPTYAKELGCCPPQGL
jgi:hypothetical protein